MPDQGTTTSPASLYAVGESLDHDGLVNVATGRSRTETKWKNTELRWSDLVAKLRRTTRTRETVAQYKKMNRTDQSDAKDVGGFVGGILKEGRRRSGHVLARTMLTLDADYAGQEFIEDLQALFPYAFAAYTTHSHTPEQPRWRLVIPFSKPISADACDALGRITANDIGIDLFDDSTYEPERLMFWPSTPDDGEYRFILQDAPLMDPEEILAGRPFWQDASTWPESSRQQHTRKKHAERQGDPHNKPGAIGAFNRAYTVPEAIEAFLPDVYAECDVENRYTYLLGSTAAGLVIYDGGKFAFSNHGTDPAGGQLCSAFDLVRIHRFGELDDDKTPDTPMNQLPSYAEMTRWAIEDSKTRVELAAGRRDAAAGDFAPEDTAWMSSLAFTEKGVLAKTINNALLLMTYDTNIKDAIGYDTFNRRPVTIKPVPWKAEPGAWQDSDDSGLRHYLESTHRFKSREDVNDALLMLFEQHTYHPIIDYLDGLAWDGVPRLDTLLIDMMDAADTAYTRQVTRKWLAAAVARVRNPGVKFDTMLILIGEQGVGKSQFFTRLARHQSWFSDSISRFDNTKDCMEQLAGKWILEIGELAGMKKAEVDGVKTFMSKASDDYRTPYSRRPQNFPRQCVFAGTTNRDDFMQDATGGRRFWPVAVGASKRMWDEMTTDYIDQVWAEADEAYAQKERLFLEGSANEQATELQTKYTETGGKPGMAELFLAQKVPLEWNQMCSADRVNWINGFDFGGANTGTYLREAVSGVELYVECFGGQKGNYKRADSYEMTDILRQIGWRKDGRNIKVVDYGKQRTFTPGGK